MEAFSNKKSLVVAYLPWHHRLTMENFLACHKGVLGTIAEINWVVLNRIWEEPFQLSLIKKN
jgi:hypothetical protein